MVGAETLSRQDFVWLIGSLCQVNRLPFDAALLLQNFPAPHSVIISSDDIDAVGSELLPGILKTARMGYDGKGQVRVRSLEELHAAYAGMNGVVCVLEKMLPLAYEVSVLTARGEDGEAVVYPIAENVHRDGILFTTTVPGPLPAK